MNIDKLWKEHAKREKLEKEQLQEKLNHLQLLLSEKGVDPDDI